MNERGIGERNERGVGERGVGERGLGERGPGDGGPDGGLGGRTTSEADRGILDSVRRILATDAARATGDRRPAPGDDAVFDLDPATIVDPADASFTDEARDGRATPVSDRHAGTSAGRPADPGEAGDDRAVPRPGVETGRERQGGVLGEEAGRGAGRAFASLRTAFREKASVAVHRGGPTIEDLVREELRPLLREWLDAELPPLVEKLVRAEIARIAERG